MLLTASVQQTPVIESSLMKPGIKKQNHNPVCLFIKIKNKQKKDTSPIHIYIYIYIYERIRKSNQKTNHIPPIRCIS